MEDKIHFCVITTDGIKYEKTAHYVGVPLENANIGIMANHAPLLAAVKDGTAKCKFDDTIEYIYVGNGVVDVYENNVIMLVRAAEPAQDIDISRAEASEQRARERIGCKDKATDIARAKASLQRALAREQSYHLCFDKK